MGRILAGLSCLGLLAFSTACGKSGSSPVDKVVKSASLTTYLQGGDQWIQTLISLDTGGFVLAGINVPIVDPTNLGEEYGEISLLPNIAQQGGDNGGDLRIALNVTHATRVQGVAPVLPNGTPLPIGGIGNTPVIAIPIGDATVSSRLYFAFGSGVAFLGTALSFAALDPAGQYAPNVDIFEPFHIGNVNLIAGLFTGTAVMSSGIGLFIDLSGVINQAPASFMAKTVGTDNKLVFEPVKTDGGAPLSVDKENKLYRKLYQLSKKRNLIPEVSRFNK